MFDYAAGETALESNRNPFAAVVLAHLKTLELRRLYRVIDAMMKLLPPLSELAWREIRDFEKERSVSFITGAQRVEREEGLAEGLAQGLQQGLQQGRKEAREDLLTGIATVLELRFAASGVALLPEIRQIDDLDLLRKILQAVKQADGPEALRRLWGKA